MSKRRNKRERSHRLASIPVDSFSDIAFLLIIYFMIATTLLKVYSIVANVPTGQKTAEAQIDKVPVVNLRGGDVYFSDKKISFENLAERLAALHLADKPADKRVIMLESSNQTPYDLYFRTLASISASGGVVALVEAEDKK